MSARGATGRTGHRLTSRSVFPMVSAIVVVLAALVWTPVLLGPVPVPIPHPPAWVGAIFAAGFVMTELLPLRVDIRQIMVLVSLSELPLVLAVVLIPAWLVGLTYLAAGLVVYLIRRDPWRSSMFNLALIAAESGVAVMVMNVAGTATPTGDMVAAGQRFVPAAAGVLLGALVSAIAVGVAHRLIGPAESLARVVGRSLLSAALAIGFALGGFTIWNAPLGGPVLCGVLIALAALLYWSYVGFLRQHTDLAAMYEFGRAVVATDRESDGWRELLEQVRVQLRATGAVLRLVGGRDGPQQVAACVDESDPAVVPSDDAIFAAADATDGVISQADRADASAIREAMRRRGALDAITIPLRSGDRRHGYLEVRNRQSRWSRFRADDLRLLQTLGAHLAAALDNQRLLGQLHHEAYHDPVTRLPNRAGLQALAQELEASHRLGGVLLIQVDMLSEVNSALGHDRGEQLLEVMGQRLTAAAGPDMPVGRLEADRFAVLLDSETEDAAVACAESVLAAAGRLLSTDRIEIEPKAIAGLALAASSAADGRDDSSLLQRAEFALLAARARNEPFAIYRAAMGEVYHRRFQLATQFRRAVDSGRVTLQYQPKVALVDRELIGVEALVRWMHPEYGLVSPAELIDAIENTASIDVLLYYVLDQALAQVVEWNHGGRRIGVAVNLSVRNLMSPDFTDLVTAALERHGADADLLTLEITESSIMEHPERSLPVLTNLHSIGVQLSIDDFGTGYSSLAYLRRLPIDEIKIDKSFVQGMVTDLGDLAIVRAIIDLGHSLGLRVIAEGVEEEAGRDALRSMRCDAMQGFLLSRPLPIDRFDTWLASRAVPVEADLGQAAARLHVRA